MRRAAVLAMLGVGSAWAQCDVPDSSPKMQAASAVFARLTEASGSGKPAPRLRMQKSGCPGAQGGARGAWYAPADNAVTLDEALYDRVCAARGAGAHACLAFVLGHELAHYYLCHECRRGLDGLAAQPGEKVDHRNADREREADLFGGIAGYRAGFDSLADAGDVLKQVYVVYKLAAETAGYPPLAERLKIAQQARTEVEKLIPIFDAGNLLFLLGDYESAALCFDEVARQFDSREVLNNAGLAYAMLYASLVERKDALDYPWILDSKSRMSLAAGQGRGGGRHADPAQVFEEAKKRLQAAITRDADYVPAYLNLACLLDVNPASSKYAALASVEEGIAHSGRMPGLRPTAEALRELLLKRPVAKLQPAVEKEECDSPEEDRIGDERPSELLSPRVFDSAQRVAGNSGIAIRLKQFADYDELFIGLGDTMRVFVSTRASYNKATARGVKAGTPRKMLEDGDHYCAASQEMLTASGRFLHFRKAQTIFLLGAGDTVEKWFLYASR